MSLLNSAGEKVRVYPAETYTTRDGNKVTRAGLVGTNTRAVVQPIQPDSNDSDERGYTGETLYRVRITSSFLTALGEGSIIEWRGMRLSVVSAVLYGAGNRRTQHWDYRARRVG